MPKISLKFCIFSIFKILNKSKKNNLTCSYKSKSYSLYTIHRLITLSLCMHIEKSIRFNCWKMWNIKLIFYKKKQTKQVEYVYVYFLNLFWGTHRKIVTFFRNLRKTVFFFCCESPFFLRKNLIKNGQRHW